MSLITVEELDCLKHLASAWNIFTKLKRNKHPMDDYAFCSKIHELQYMIAARVARRDDRDVWTAYEGTNDKNQKT
jgi:hypothetical protein